MLAILTYFGYCLGGFPLAVGTALATGFLLVSGSWDKAMLSLYLCSLSVLVAFFSRVCAWDYRFTERMVFQAYAPR